LFNTCHGETHTPKPASGNGHAAPPITNHPLASVIGVFQDNPEFDALMEQIHDARKRRDAEESGMTEDCKARVAGKVVRKSELIAL